MIRLDRPVPKHAKAIGADQERLSQIEELNKINPRDKDELQERVDPIIQHFGDLAVASQPDFTH